MNRIELDVGDEGSRRLWMAVGDLVDRLPGEWVLIGGLMVQLHALEHGITDVRPTRDIDVLGQARPPGALKAIDEVLRVEGFEAIGPDVDGFAHRYERGDFKVRSIMRHADPEAQREDLLRLLALVEDPRTLAADLKKSERKWLRKAEDRLNFDGLTLLDDATVRNARLTYRILLRES